jgi:hypothetical protein
MSHVNPQPNQPTQPTQPSRPQVSPQSGPRYVQQQAAPKSTTAMGVTALVLGIIAVIFSFIPIINNVAIILGFLGLIFAIVGIVATKKNGKKKGRGIAIASLVLTVIALVISFSMQAAWSSALDSATKSSSSPSSSSTSKSTDDSATKAEESKSGEQKNEGDLTSAHASIVSLAKSNNDYNGKPTVLVSVKWTNTSDDNQLVTAALNPKAYQKGKSLDTAIYTNAPKGYDANAELSEIKAGASTTTTLAYVLEDSSTDVEVELSDFIGGDATITRTFSLK